MILLRCCRNLLTSCQYNLLIHWLGREVSGLEPGLTLAQRFLEDQKGEEDELDEFGGCWGDRGVDEFV